MDKKVVLFMFLRLVNMNSKSKIANLKMKEPKWRTETL
jgi:hypothetical protein